MHFTEQELSSLLPDDVFREMRQTGLRGEQRVSDGVVMERRLVQQLADELIGFGR